MARRDVTVKLPTLDRIVPPGSRQALLEKIANFQIGRIKRRTAAGLDVNGNPFAPYSARYAEQRRKSGRETDRVQLRLTSGMMDSITVVSASAQRAVLGFKGASAAGVFARRSGGRKVKGSTHAVGLSTRQVSNALKARWNDKGDGNAPARHFFGFSAEDRVFLARTALRELTRMAGRVYLGRALRRR